MIQNVQFVNSMLLLMLSLVRLLNNRMIVGSGSAVWLGSLSSTFAEFVVTIVFHVPLSIVALLHLNIHRMAFRKGVNLSEQIIESRKALVEIISNCKSRSTLRNMQSHSTQNREMYIDHYNCRNACQEKCHKNNEEHLGISFPPLSF